MDYLLLRHMFEDPLEKINRAAERKSRFLLRIAREVDRLIQKRSNLDRFRQQVTVFVRGCQISLGLKQPSQHEATIHLPYLLAPVLQGGCPKEWPKPQKKEQLLPDYYFLLQLIHDNLLSQPQFIAINNSFYNMEDDWVKCCWQYYRTHATDSKEKGLIETALEHVKADLSAETEQKAAPSPINIQNSNVIWGDVNQPGNLQVGDHAQIQEQTVTEEKKNGSFKKLLKIIAAIVGFLAALLAIFNHLGWLEPIKRLFTK